ncbi:MAG TPA: CapA family protein [Clostridiaceae bacterium]|nr:CapA family protein [Clostridiaceae bacterium]
MKIKIGRILFIILIFAGIGFGIGRLLAYIFPGIYSELPDNKEVKEFNSEKADLPEQTDNDSQQEGQTEDEKGKEEVQENVKKEEPLSIVAVGDIMLGRGVGSRIKKQSLSYTHVFEKVADILKEGDIVFGNLEGPITDKTHSLTAYSKTNTNGKFVLKGTTESFEALKYAGFNMLSLANNHILDYYQEGLFDTIDILKENGIAFSGAGSNLEEARKPAIIEKNGLKIGLLSYTDFADIVYAGNPRISFAAGENKAGVAPIKYEYIKEDIANIESEVDILMVSLHWGVEESFEILPSQVELAHDLIDSGADVILGHHPHQFQGMEVYKGKPIFYSLGNFIFDQNDPENQESFIVNMQFTGTKLTAISAAPVRTIDKIQVMPVSGDDAKQLLEREAKLSSKLGTEFRIENDRLLLADIADY